MMDLIQNGFSCAYDMDIFINMFFEKNEEGIIMTNLTHEKNIINVYVEIIYKGITYTGDYYYDFFNDEKDSKNIKKNYTCSVTKAFCFTAQKIRNVSMPWGVMSGIRPAKVVRQYKQKGYSYDEIKDILIKLYSVSEKKSGFMYKSCKK